MTIPYRPDSPDEQSVKLTLVDAGLAVSRWSAYEFRSDFLTPADSFDFSLGLDDEGLPDELRVALKFGAKVQLSIGGATIATGYIDSFDISGSRGSGAVLGVRGRDKLGQALDAVVDPAYQLKTGGTLADLLETLFAPFGWSAPGHFEIDNSANRDARSGGARGTPVGKAKGTPLKSFVLHQTKPYNHEAVFHFASRVAQRFGLWIWASADGEKLVVGKPDFAQAPRFMLVRDRKGNGNILEGSVNFDMTDQPTMIIADSFSGGAEFGKGRCKAYAVSPALGLTDEGDPTSEVAALVAKYKGAVEVVVPTSAFPFRAANIPFRPMFLHDDESKTPAQLANFVRREMSLLLRRALSAQYTVAGHGQTVDDIFRAWTPDTVVEVRDELARLTETLYVLGVHYSRSRRSGTTTRLDLVRLHSISF